MKIRYRWLVLCLTLASCTAPPVTKVVTQYEEVRCPPQPIVRACPAFPIQVKDGETLLDAISLMPLAEVLHLFGEAHMAHRQCIANVDSWEAAYQQACRPATPTH